MPENDGLFKRAHEALKTKFLPTQIGKTFTSDDVYRFFGLNQKAEHTLFKASMAEVLYYLSHRKASAELEQRGRVYRIINRDMRVISWADAQMGDTLEINWPCEAQGISWFDFEKSILVYPKDLIVLAGEGNTAKTAFCLNFMIENMDRYPVFFFTSEFNAPKFRDRMANFDWVNLYREDGSPKFTLVQQDENWQDVIQPNAINIIDWIRLDDDLYKIRGILGSIVDRLDRGIALAVLQKRTYKLVGEGGEGTKDFASVYLTIRYDKAEQSRVLKVDKVKSPGEYDPNFYEYKFGLEKGCKFHSIERIP